MAHRIVRAAFDRLDAARSEFARTIADLSGRPDFLDALLHEDAPRELAALVLESGAPQTQQLATAALARLAASAASVAGALVATGAVAAVCSRTDVAGAHPAVLAGACAIVRAVASHGGELSEAVLDAGAAGVVVRRAAAWHPGSDSESTLVGAALTGSAPSRSPPPPPRRFAHSATTTLTRARRLRSPRAHSRAAARCAPRVSSRPRTAPAPRHSS